MSKPRRPHTHTDTHTNSFIWCGAILCAIIAVVVIISGVVLFIGYLTIKPKIPLVSVARATLDTVYFDQSNLLTLQVTVVIKAENDNTKAHVSFYNTSLTLSLGSQKIAYLVAGAFTLPPNKSMELNYISQTGAIPLNPEEADAVNLLLRRGVMNFNLNGVTKTRWSYGFITSVKFTLHLNCPLQLPVDRTPAYPHCNSRMK